MMEETNRTFTDDEGEETMVSPRFDDEETVLARPVVPFEEVSDAPPATSASAPLPPLYSRLRAAPRRSLVAALVLISVLVGSALGVAGLYFYQKHRGDDAPTAAVEQQQQVDVPAPAATAAQATPEPAPESQARETNAQAAEPPAPAPAPTERDARAEGDAPSSKGSGREEAVAAPVVERRDISEGRETVVNPKHGKKSERDDEQRREARRENRDNADDQPVRADDDDDNNGREARRVGVITYRQRRARMRRDNYGNADRLRRIFEGQP
jgi:hypothetical protein